jgi:hypothetical protein
MSSWMEPPARIVTMTPRQVEQHRQSLEAAEGLLEEMVQRAGKSPGPSTKARIRELEKQIQHTRNLLGEGAWITHKDGRDEFLGVEKPRGRVRKPAPRVDDDSLGLLEKTMLVARAIEREFVEKQPEKVADAPAPTENPPTAGKQQPLEKQSTGMQLSLFDLPAPPKNIARGRMKDRLRSMNRTKTSI